MKNYTITVNGNVYDVVVEEGASRFHYSGARHGGEYPDR